MSVGVCLIILRKPSPEGPIDTLKKAAQLLFRQFHFVTHILPEHVNRPLHDILEVEV